ncbi:MAG: sulfite exporter TauE/SafE family protein [Polyangiaceae bacterium]
MIDPTVALAGLFVGFVVGLTGMGGGALMTPILVLLFKVQPLVAVSSDIVAAMVMKPVGGSVHWRRGTVNTQLVKWLMLGSVPSAFLGVLLLKLSGTGPALQERVKLGLGLALFVVAAGLIMRPLLTRGRQSGDSLLPLHVRPLQTVLIGVAGGLVVGLTSVGSGSLMMILLLVLYPKLSLKELVGTDLVQAIPLVASAALGHVLFGDFKLALTASILVGSVPGVFLGAQLSSRAPDTLIRPALIAVLIGSSMKLLGTSNWILALTLVAFAVAYFGVQRVVRGGAEGALPAKSQKANA